MSEHSTKARQAIVDIKASLNLAYRLRDQWIAGTQQNPINMTKKDIDQTEKALKNKLLTVKWDCEDLEELLAFNNLPKEVIDQSKAYISQARKQVSEIMDEMDDVYNGKVIKEKDDPSNQVVDLNSFSDNDSPNDKYQKVNNDDTEIVFDINQIENSNANVYNNELHDYYEYENLYRNKNGIHSTQVFNNLTRPLANVSHSNNDTETIVGMLETEYYSPPLGVSQPSTTSKIVDIVRERPKTFTGFIIFVILCLLIL